MADLLPISSVLSRGPMPLAQSAKIAVRICRLLQPMHAKGARHGAVIPENVLFRHVGSDLIVELRDDALPSAQYVPPERVRGEAEGAASDVYLVGVLLFHMASGFPPFDGDSADEILAKHAQAPPPPLAASELQDVPIELERLIFSMLSKVSGERPTVTSVVEQIENIDLDSTVMGERLASLGDLDEEPPKPTARVKLDPALLQNVAVDQEKLKTDPAIVDPYAQTFIRDRAVFGLAEVDGDQPTALSVERQRVVVEKPKATGQWSDDSTRILEDTSGRVAAFPNEEGARNSRLLFAVGAAFFIGALALAIWAILR